MLLIDDETAIITALSVRFRAAGMTTRSANCGEQGLALACEQPPDVVLLDVRMPDMTGIEVCRRLKNHPDTAQVPVVFLSAETSEQTRDAALSAGGARFISKPYDAADLLRAVHEVVAMRHESPDPVPRPTDHTGPNA
jgi:CheY-like chemotaxis protein